MNKSKSFPYIKIRYLDGSRLLNSLLAGIKPIEKKQHFLNKINVFPIPDQDTGTNMLATMNSILLKKNQLFHHSISVTSLRISDAALSGAQGYSGIILAQFLNGFAKGLKGKYRISTIDLARAIQSGKNTAYSTLKNPVEGTILSVIKDWSDFILKNAHQLEDFVALLMNSLSVVHQSVKDTTSKLAVLKKARVVDAGAKGFEYLLEGIIDFVQHGKMYRKNSFEYRFNTVSDIRDIKSGQERDHPSDTGKIGIVTDSSCDLPDSFLKNNQVHIIPLKISFESETFLDKVQITPSEFYNKLSSSNVHPKTSQPALADIHDTFGRIIAKYDKIISIHLPRMVSGTFQVIEKAAQTYGDKIICIDGKTISAGLGLIIIETIRLIKKGLSLEDIISQINQFIQNIKIFIILPTLKYLVKGGRISKPKGIIGRLLHLKPIVSFDQNGSIYLLAKSFGEKNAFKRSFELAKAEASKYKRFQFMVAHANALEKAKWTVDQLSQIFPTDDEIQIVEAAPALGVHAGPGTIGFGFIGYHE